MITLDTFITDFGETIGIPGFQLDAEGEGRLAVGGHVIDVLGDRRDGRLMLSCLVGELPDPGRETAMARLMDANCMLRGTRGGTLGVPAGSGAVVLARAIDTSRETGESLAHAVVALADAAEECRALLTVDADPLSAASDPAMSMIRV